MEKTSKKELKIVLSTELYDELKYVFRPDQLENIIYRPYILGDKRWQCCCGSESELEICPICGMEKHTVFSKVNANYLSHHRKMRIARKRKAMQDQQAMMAAQIVKKNKKSKKKKNVNSKRTGTLLGVLFLCVAVIICIAIIFGGQDTSTPVDTHTTDTVTTNNKPQETKPQDSKPDETTANTPDTDITTAPVPDTDETTVPPVIDTTPPETIPTEPIVVPSEEINKNPATVLDGKWAEGASGNVSAGALVYSGKDYDFVAKDGIKIFDKNGAEAGVLTTNKAIAIAGAGNDIFYIDESNAIHKINTETKEDIAFSIKAKQICAIFDEVYYTSPDETGLFACNYNGQKTKILTTLEVFTVSVTANKLYFSTSESLAVISAKNGNVITFCKDGAKATSILEITSCVFYTGTDGRLKFFNPAKDSGFSVEYPIYNYQITHVSAFENRVYIRTVNPETNAVYWYSTTWTSGTKLFAPANFTFTGITTQSLYVTNNAIYDGNLNRTPIA